MNPNLYMQPEPRRNPLDRNPLQRLVEAEEDRVLINNIEMCTLMVIATIAIGVIGTLTASA